jgi:hypothetical protein
MKSISSHMSKAGRTITLFKSEFDVYYLQVLTKNATASGNPMDLHIILSTTDTAEAFRAYDEQREINRRQEHTT